MHLFLRVGQARVGTGCALAGWLFLSLTSGLLRAESPASYDVIVYGGTSAGVVAAVEVARGGKSVLVIEPSQHLGGMTSGGLGATDIGKEAAIGGLAREFYQRIAQKYRDPGAWRHQTREEYFSHEPAIRIKDPAVMWTFEPKVALEVFRDWLRERRVEVRFGERLRQPNGVRKTGARIVEITMESGTKYRAQVFIDAGYEGDLMAAAGVSYAVGRESREQYGESLNGATGPVSYPHERRQEIDAFLVKGDRASGLLPTVQAAAPAVGSADPGIMASGFRMCLTNQPANRIPIEKPADYRELDYELLLRSIEAGRTDKFFSLNPMPNGKTDCNSTEPFSTNYVGMNHAYPDGDYAMRERIVADHRRYQTGYLWTLQNHPRVPAEIRAAMSEWGLPKDEFVESGHWPPQLYLREGRRMLGQLVMTQQHGEGTVSAPEPVGMGSYTLDCHYVQRYADAAGMVRHEGYFDQRVQPYGIGYGAVVPRAGECANLLVPVCVSASHVGYASIRMEPVFMVLGQAAGAAACLALEDGVTVQGVEYAKLRQRLLAEGQVLELTAKAAPARPAAAVIGREIVNAGVGGNTSTQLLARLQRDVLARRPDLVILLAGTNDMLNVGRLVPLAEYARNMARLVSAIREAGAEVILLTPPPCYVPYLFERHDRQAFAGEDPNEKIRAAGDVIRALAREQHVGLVDLYPVFMEGGALEERADSLLRNTKNAGSRDGVHPTPEGYRTIAEMVRDAMAAQGLLQRRRIVCFGDSITFGASVDGQGTVTGATYPARLSALLPPISP